jgi:pimeloyl-ACP methyl ester carboxylesterase
MNRQKIIFNNIPICFKSKGKGKTLVLLHGYLESLDIWGEFADELAEKYHVITIDLLGHGKSGNFGEVSTVENMAECVHAVIDYLHVDKAIIIGHSMGGYAMLAFAEMWPDKLLGLGLFHSVSWSDVPEKREARNREIELVRQGKKQLIFNVNVPKSFANDNLEIFKEKVELAKRIAAEMSDEGIIAVLQAMKNRKDRTFILEKSGVPIFFAVGMKDNYIPPEKLLALATKPKSKYVVVFENSGHMAFIEEKNQAIDELINFIEMC